MNLPAGITDALVHGEGEFAPFLRLAQQCESFDGSGLTKAVDDLHLPCERVNHALLTGLGFADSLQA